MPLTPELQALAQRVSNWGRWGPDDQRGTLNLVDTAAVQRGISSARQGRPFSLAIPFDQSGPQWDSNNMPDRINPELNTYMVNLAFTGSTDDFTTTDDAFRMGTQAATHIDALAHVGYSGKLWNDTPNSVVTKAGAAQLGIEHVGAFATRGVILDIARLKGVEHFDDAYPISGDDLQAAAMAAGVVVQPGDAVLVRTGQMYHVRAGEKRAYSMPSPGLSARSIEWIREHDVALVATDNLTFECYPGEDPTLFMPATMILLRDMGLGMAQNWNLDELAADCAADGQYDCLLVATPLPLTGAAGAPVAPTAIK